MCQIQHQSCAVINFGEKQVQGNFRKYKVIFTIQKRLENSFPEIVFFYLVEFEEFSPLVWQQNLPHQTHTPMRPFPEYDVSKNKLIVIWAEPGFETVQQNLIWVHSCTSMAGRDKIAKFFLKHTKGFLV